MNSSQASSPNIPSWFHFYFYLQAMSPSWNGLSSPQTLFPCNCEAGWIRVGKSRFLDHNDEGDKKTEEPQIQYHSSTSTGKLYLFLSLPTGCRPFIPISVQGHSFDEVWGDNLCRVWRTRRIGGQLCPLFQEKVGGPGRWWVVLNEVGSFTWMGGWSRRGIEYLGCQAKIWQIREEPKNNLKVPVNEWMSGSWQLFCGFDTKNKGNKSKNK